VFSVTSSITVPEFITNINFGIIKPLFSVGARLGPTPDPDSNLTGLTFTQVSKDYSLIDVTAKITLTEVK
jgi:hypothetical protein